MTEDGEPVCSYGGHIIGPGGFYYVVNPLGGFGRDEVLCCDICIVQPQNIEARRRMIEAGADELKSKH